MNFVCRRWGGPLPKMLPDGTRLTFYKFAPKVAKQADQMNWMMFYMLSLGYIELQLSQPGQPLHIECIFDVEHYTMGVNNSFIAHLGEFRRFVQCIQVSVAAQRADRAPPPCSRRSVDGRV